MGKQQRHKRGEQREQRGAEEGECAGRAILAAEGEGEEVVCDPRRDDTASRLKGLEVGEVRPKETMAVACPHMGWGGEPQEAKLRPQASRLPRTKEPEG